MYRLVGLIKFGKENHNLWTIQRKRNAYWPDKLSEQNILNIRVGTQPSEQNVMSFDIKKKSVVYPHICIA